MASQCPGKKNKFHVALIKPSHYDEDGYVIQWRRFFSISNTLSCLYSMSLDAAERRILGENVDIIVNAYDDFSADIPTKKIIRNILKENSSGLVCLVGVQTNQYPRALDIALPFLKENIPVIIGGFHVSGTIAMSQNIPSHLQKAIELGISLFAGEAEGKLPEVFLDAYRGKLKSIYNHLDELPDLRGQPTPFLTEGLVKKSLSSDIPIDTSRGCPFKCSFCTIINVQGRKSRFRTADDVENMIRFHSRRGNKTAHFFFTDDNFARNGNWEEILDRLIYLRENEGLKIKFGIQVDSQAYKMKSFVEKAARAGCNWVCIGIESINIENIKSANKGQNKVDDYKDMLKAWRSKKIVTMAGYILGFPGDTPESIERDIKTIKAELPVDILMFFSLTPLPGSEDYNKMIERGDWMETDFNRYDTEHAVINHPLMSGEEWEGIFRKAWELYYDSRHVETILRRAISDGIGTGRLTGRILICRAGIRLEKVHPFQCGLLRRKVRKQRRSGMPIENPLVFYPRRFMELLRINISILIYFLRIELMIRRLKRERRLKKLP